MIYIEDLTDAQKDDLLIQLLDRETDLIVDACSTGSLGLPSKILYEFRDRVMVVNKLTETVKTRQRRQNSPVYQDLLFRRDEDSKDAEDDKGLTAYGGDDVHESHEIYWYAYNRAWICSHCGLCLCHHKQKLTEECQPRIR